jgi:hypothetical protein
MVNLLKHKYILFMKAGPHSGDSLEEIINMKLEEESKIGKFFWGYSGSLCHPFKVQEFCWIATKENEEVMLILSETKSAYGSKEEIRKVSEYSIDGKNWNKLPESIHLWNCKFAVTASKLRKVDQYIDLNEYVVVVKNGEVKLGEYIRYRVNKACAILKNQAHIPRLVKISYIATLVPPFCIFVR